MSYQDDFINLIAPAAQWFAYQYSVKCPSAVIAQACHETGFGRGKGAEIKVAHHNYFGLKYRPNRVDCNSGYFRDGSYEEYKKGELTPISTDWYAFEDVAHGVCGYFEFLFLNTTRYESLKNISDPHEYLLKIKELGYATGSNYGENCYKVVEQYNLTRFDNLGVSKMIINVHAGHNPDGMVGYGAVGLIKESTEARKVKDLVIKKLQSLGHTVYDCTCDNGKSQGDVLQQIVKKCNAHTVDLDVSIHFNAGGGAGTEILVYGANSKSLGTAKNTVNTICALGFKNRGVKYRPDLYVLKNTKAPAMLIECCFVDSVDDIKRYNPELMAQAIVKGLTGQSVVEPIVDDGIIYRVQLGAYKNKANAEAKVNELKKQALRR